MEGLTLNWRSIAMVAVCAVIGVVALLLFFRQHERRARWFLSAFLAAVVVEVIPQIIGFAGAYDQWPQLSFWPLETELYFGPLLYLHAFSLVSAQKLGWRWALLIPGLLQTSYYSSIVLAMPSYQDRWAYDATIHTPIVSPIETVVALALTIGSIIAVFRLVRDYQSHLNATESTDQFEPVWLRLLLPFIAAVGGLAIILQLSALMYGHIGYTNEYPLLLASAIGVAWLSIEALRRLTVPFPKFSESTATESTPAAPKTKDWTAEGETLKRAVIEGRWFLEPTFSLRDLAERLATNDAYASRAINQGLQMNFRTFVNSLRIEHAKGLLHETRQSVIEVAMASGFNSKATFNRVFSKHVGRTPTAYRRQRSTKSRLNS